MEKRCGFTIIELLATIVILGILSSITILGISKVIKDGKKNTAKVSLEGYVREIENAVALYLASTGTYPNSVNDLNIDGKNIEKIDNANVRLTSGKIKKITAQIGEIYFTYEITTGVICDEEPFLVEITYQNIGDEIYYNPVNNTICTTCVENNSASGIIEGCLKWYILSINEDNSINLILDHNIASGVKWNESSESSQGPTKVLEMLNNIIKDKWSNRLIRTDSYTHTFNNKKENKTYIVNYSGMKARIPEVGEIVKALGYDTWNEKEATTSSWFYLDSKSQSQTVGYNRTQKVSDYDWLYNNLGGTSNDNSKSNSCLYWGCTMAKANTKGDEGYWTSTALNNSSSSIWGIYDRGGVNYDDTTWEDNGIRPVITLLSSE